MLGDTQRHARQRRDDTVRHATARTSHDDLQLLGL
jgi:hypothetical protein